MPPGLGELLKALAMALVPWFAELIKGWVEKDNEKKQIHKQSRRRLGAAMRSRDRDAIHVAITRRGMPEHTDSDQTLRGE